MKSMIYPLIVAFSFLMSSCSDQAGIFHPGKDYVYGALMKLPSGDMLIYENQIVDVFAKHDLELEARRIADSPKMLFFSGNTTLTISGSVSEDSTQLEYGIAKEHDGEDADSELIILGKSISAMLVEAHGYIPLREFISGDCERYESKDIGFECVST